MEVRALLPDDVATCTLLRDPVERTLSHYGHIVREPPPSGEADGLTLDAFVRSPRWRLLWVNYRARHLVHEIGITRLHAVSVRDRLDEPLASRVLEHEFPLQSLFDSEALRLADDDLFEAAIRRLDDVEFVGVSDDVAHLCRRIAASWSVEPELPGRVNDNPARVRTSEVSRGGLDAIRAGTEVDRALYERTIRTLRAGADGERSRSPDARAV